MRNQVTEIVLRINEQNILSHKNTKLSLQRTWAVIQDLVFFLTSWISTTIIIIDISQKKLFSGLWGTKLQKIEGKGTLY